MLSTFLTLTHKSRFQRGQKLFPWLIWVCVNWWTQPVSMGSAGIWLACFQWSGSSGTWLVCFQCSGSGWTWLVSSNPVHYSTGSRDGFCFARNFNYVQNVLKTTSTSVLRFFFKVFWSFFYTLFLIYCMNLRFVAWSCHVDPLSETHRFSVLFYAYFEISFTVHSL